MHILASLMTLVGALLLYLSHRNQMLINGPLAQVWRWIGVATLGIAALLLLMILPKAVALLTWLLIPIAVWTFVPFFALSQYKDIEHEH